MRCGFRDGRTLLRRQVRLQRRQRGRLRRINLCEADRRGAAADPRGRRGEGNLLENESVEGFQVPNVQCCMKSSLKIICRKLFIKERLRGSYPDSIDYIDVRLIVPPKECTFPPQMKFAV